MDWECFIHRGQSKNFWHATYTIYANAAEENICPLNIVTKEWKEIGLFPQNIFVNSKPIWRKEEKEDEEEDDDDGV